MRPRVWVALLPHLNGPDPAPWHQLLQEQWTTIGPDVARFRNSPNPMDRRIELGGRFLAAVRVAESRGWDDAALRAAVLAGARDLVTPRHEWGRRLLRLRTRVLLWPPVFRAFSRKAQAQESQTVPEGFRVQFVPGVPGSFVFGMDFLACGLCALFRRHGSGRHTRLLCEVDHLTASLAGLHLSRTGTLAEGADRCDFRWTPEYRSIQ